MGERPLNCEVGPLGVDVEDLVVELFGRLGERCELPHPRIHEEHVDVAELLRHHPIEPLDVLQLGHVCLHREQAVTDGLHGLVERPRTPSGDGHLRPLLLKASRGCQPDAAVASRHDRHLAFQSLHACLRGRRFHRRHASVITSRIAHQNASDPAGSSRPSLPGPRRYTVGRSGRRGAETARPDPFGGAAPTPPARPRTCSVRKGRWRASGRRRIGGRRLHP